MLRNKSHNANRVVNANVNAPQHPQHQQGQSSYPMRARTTLSRSRIIALLGALFFSYSYFFAWLNTTDPCLIANIYAPETIAQLQRRRRQDDQNESFYYDEPPLPKIIHQQWKTAQIPQGKYTEWRQAWLDLYPAPEYQHILWTDDSMRQLVSEHYPWFLPIYDGYLYNIQRADVARYFILHYHGGLYADLDYQPLVNFWNRIPSNVVSLIESPYKYNEQHQNSLMASPKGDIFWQPVFDALMVQQGSREDNSSSSSSSFVFSKTGPQFLDQVARQTGGPPFYTLPCENFHRVPFVQNRGEESPWITRVGHHTLARFYPMKNCGDFSQSSLSSPLQSCQYGKHHNAVSYLQETGGLI